jgi:hypothetical protein
LEFNYITPENIEAELKIISDNEILMGNYNKKQNGLKKDPADKKDNNNQVAPIKTKSKLESGKKQ